MNGGENKELVAQPLCFGFRENASLTNFLGCMFHRCISRFW